MVVGHTDELDGELAARELLEQCRDALGGERPQAGMLLASHDVDLEELAGGVSAGWADLDLIGCTTLAPLSSAGGYGDGATTLTLFGSDVVDITTGLGRGVASSVDAAVREAVQQATHGTDKQPALAIVTPSVEAYDPASICDEIARVLGTDVPIFGGGSVPDYPMEPSWTGAHQFYGGEVLTDTLPLLVMSGPLHVSVGVRHGWTPVGRTAVVTRAKGETIFEVDGEPVTEFFGHYVAMDEAGAPATPLAILDDETGRHYLRAPISVDRDEGSMRFHGSVPEGTTVRIAMASPDQILDGTRGSVGEALGSFPEGQRPEAALVSSCAIRNWLLGSRAATEVEIITGALGPSVPVSGFYAFGEVSPMRAAGRTQFHNETCVTVLIGT